MTVSRAHTVGRRPWTRIEPRTQKRLKRSPRPADTPRAVRHRGHPRHRRVGRPGHRDPTGRHLAFRQPGVGGNTRLGPRGVHRPLGARPRPPRRHRPGVGIARHDRDEAGRRPDPDPGPDEPRHVDLPGDPRLDGHVPRRAADRARRPRHDPSKRARPRPGRRRGASRGDGEHARHGAPRRRRRADPGGQRSRDPPARARPRARETPAVRRPRPSGRPRAGARRVAFGLAGTVARPRRPLRGGRRLDRRVRVHRQEPARTTPSSGCYVFSGHVATP